MEKSGNGDEIAEMRASVQGSVGQRDHWRISINTVQIQIKYRSDTDIEMSIASGDNEQSV